MDTNLCNNGICQNNTVCCEIIKNSEKFCINKNQSEICLNLILTTIIDTSTEPSKNANSQSNEVFTSFNVYYLIITVICLSILIILASKCGNRNVIRAYYRRNQSSSTRNLGIQFANEQANPDAPVVSVIDIKNDYGLPSYDDVIKSKK